MIHGCDPGPPLAAARSIAGDRAVMLVGVIPVKSGDSLSEGASPARHVRGTMRKLADGKRVKGRAHVHVSHDPWRDIVNAARTEKADLLVLGYDDYMGAMGVSPEEVLASPPCDIALVRGPIPEEPVNLLMAIRGGPYAELALRLSLAIAQTRDATVTSLHLYPPGAVGKKTWDAPFLGIGRVLASLNEISRREAETDDPGTGIIEASRDFDLVIMGATGHIKGSKNSLGPIADKVLQESPSGVIIVETKQPIPEILESESVGQAAISILVDKWFAEKTWHAGEFTNLEHLLTLKQQHGLTVSLALPALNEEKTVGKVISVCKSALMENVPLLDEIVLIDSDSADNTREIAEDLGIPVYIHQQILPDYGARKGKGEALWKSLYVTRGDIVIWIDTDIVNIHPRFVYGILGPLLVNPRNVYCKGFYRRPLKVGAKIQAGGGGRVTELTARPLINLFYPELSGVIQPLSGEYGGRRSALEQIPFYSGYGVEIGLLIDILEKFGLASIAQVDLLERVHHNQSIEALSKMSFAIIQAVMHKLERRGQSTILEDVNKTMKLIRYEPRRYFLDVETIAEQERPPMVDIPEYHERKSR